MTCTPSNPCRRVTGPKWTEDQCRWCWRKKYRPANLPRKAILTPSESRELFGDDDPTLIGNRLAALTEAIGIPTCGSCQGRKAWLNRAHQWLRGIKAAKLDDR